MKRREIMAISQQLLILSVIAATVIIIDCGRTSLKIITSSALGLAGLAALHFTALAVPLNAVTIAVSAVLGLPGVGALVYIFDKII